MFVGQCHCGGVTFECADEPVSTSICHCQDCRRQSGAPLVAWALFPRGTVTMRGSPKVYRSSETGLRSFCESCGGGLFFTNAALEKMGMMQVRIAALNTPDAVAPKMQVQIAERIGWMQSIDQLPAFDRFPPPL